MTAPQIAPQTTLPVAPKRVLVTGASGFIGAHVVRVLLARGHEVAIILRPGREPWRLMDVLAQLTVIPGDLAAPDATLATALAAWRPEACIHLAWYVEPGAYLVSRENIAALQGSLRLLDALIAAGCGHVVMAGTCAEYDPDPGVLHEDGPVRPTTLYAAAKHTLHLAASQTAQERGISLAWARLFFLFGPQEDARRVVPALICALLRDEPFAATAGEQVRDYLHVTDVASALCALTEHRVDGPVNISSGAPVSMRQLMEAIGDITGAGHRIDFGALPYRSWDPPVIVGDNGRLRAATGWAPAYATLLPGLADTVAWWQAQEQEQPPA
ncbi:MAG: NAD(P)-dependent oxidoreductase [Thermomicrobiales bacterium]